MIYDLKIDDIDENSPFWHVRENISENQKVLDVGCATGYLGEYLTQTFNLDLVGIDYEDFYLEKAAERNVYSNLINLDLNDFDKELDEYISYFDRIILCDVLEHLNNPMDTLRKLSRFLNKDGKFLIDVPNIAHASIKYNLLINNFNYAPTGLLDETHIRFFTQDSIINDLSKNKFLVKDMRFILSGPGQYLHDQYVDYGKYPEEVVSFIENDVESYIYQIFLVLENSDLDFESLIKINSQFKELNKDLILKKEEFLVNYKDNPLKNLEDTIKVKDEEINKLKTVIQEMDDYTKKLNLYIDELKSSVKVRDDKIRERDSTINEMKNSNSWKITKPLRDLTSFFKK